MSTEISSPTLDSLSEKCSLYKVITNVTDNFTCCIRTYESLIPYFEGERTSDDCICDKFLKIDEIISKLNTELTALKIEMTSAVYYNSKLPDKIDKIVQKEILSEDTNRYSKSQCVSNEHKKVNEQIFHVENVVMKPVDIVDEEGYFPQETDFTNTPSDQITNEKKQSKGIETKPVLENKGPVRINAKITENQVNIHPLDTCRAEMDLSLSRKLYKAEGGSFKNIWPTETGFECTLCDKKLSGPKVIIEHVKGGYHQSLLTEFVNKTDLCEKSKNNKNVVGSKVSIASTETHTTKVVLEKTAKLRNVLKGVSHIEGSADLYILHAQGVILCALCQCQIPPTIKNVCDHLLGGNHSRKKELLSK